MESRFEGRAARGSLINAGLHSPAAVATRHDSLMGLTMIGGPERDETPRPMEGRRERSQELAIRDGEVKEG